VIPLNTRAYPGSEFWASSFPTRQLSHYVFPSERYGTAGDAFKPCAYLASGVLAPFPSGYRSSQRSLSEEPEGSWLQEIGALTGSQEPF